MTKNGNEHDGNIEKSKPFRFFPKRSILFISALSILAILTQSSSTPMATSYILEVPYHDQQTSYYCGPAAIQMVLEYSNGMMLTQDQLGAELETDLQGVTYIYSMDEPFENRMISKVKSGRTSLSQLKHRINQGYAPILLIWFDENQETGHYVVAVGYNETGVFINDPWPKQWKQPEGRETGSYVFLSNEKLSELWSNYYQWSMTVPFTQPEEKAFRVDVNLHGLPEDAKTTLYLNGYAIQTLTGSDSTSIQLVDQPDYHFLRVDTTTWDLNGTEYLCETPSYSLEESGVIEFNYKSFR